MRSAAHKRDDVLAAALALRPEYATADRVARLARLSVYRTLLWLHTLVDDGVLECRDYSTLDGPSAFTYVPPIGDDR